MRLLFISVALVGVASASSNCPWKWCKDGKREAESAGAPKPPELPPWRGKKSYPEDPTATTTLKPASENGPPFMAPFKKREAEEIPDKRAAEECDGVPPLPSCRKKFIRTADSDDDRKLASPVGPSIKGKKREAEELEIPCSEQEPKLPGCRKFKRTADSPDKRAAGDDDRKELKLPPWRFEQKRETEELERSPSRPVSAADAIYYPPILEIPVGCHPPTCMNDGFRIPAPAPPPAHPADCIPPSCVWLK